MGRGRHGDGVEARQDTIRVRFTYKGRRYYENLNLLPTPPNLKAAARLMRDVRSTIRTGTFDYAEHFQGFKPAASPVTFAEYAKAWLETLTTDEGTAAIYGDYINIWSRAFGSKLLTNIKHTHIKTAVATRARTVSGKSVNNSLTPLRAVFASAVADEIIADTPMKLIANLSHQYPKPDPLTHDEMFAVLAYMQSHYHEQVYNYFDFAFATGLRTSEEVGLMWSQVDWPGETAMIDRARVKGRDKGTKTSSVREVDLTPRALAALSRQKVHTFMRGASMPVFTNPQTGLGWVDDNIQRERFWYPALRALGLRKRDAYQTRHTFATHALMGDVNVAYIARQLGHANTAMLFKHYAKWIDGADKGRQRAKMNALYEIGHSSKGADHG